LLVCLGNEVGVDVERGGRVAVAEPTGHGADVDSRSDTALRYEHSTKDRDRAIADALAGVTTPAAVTELHSRDTRGQTTLTRSQPGQTPG